MDLGTERSTRSICQHLLLLPVCAFMAACATQLDGVKSGEPIAIVRVPASEPGTVVRTSNERVGSYGARGAPAGAGAGVALGLMCGPFAALCVPAFAGLGAVAGGGAGALVGVAAGVSGDLRQTLRFRVEAFTLLRDPSAELVSALAEAAKDRLTVVAGPANRIMTVHVRQVILETSGEDHVIFTMAALISVRNADPGAQEEPKEQWFHYAGPVTNAYEWIDDRDDFVKTSFARAYEHIARRVITQLTARRNAADRDPASSL